MPPGNLNSEIEAAGRALSRWQAEVRAFVWTGIVLACLCVLGLSDILFRFDKIGRIATWVVLLAVLVAGMKHILGALARRRTIQAIAATIEKAFPQLDNRLINYLQFAARTNGDVFREAYVRRGVPEWRSVNVKQMRNRRALRNALIVLAASIVLLGAPWLLNGRSWTVSLWRVLNPFSNCPPVTFTHILDVQPGDTDIGQGESLVITCRVQGRKGHRVHLDLKPEDDKKTTYALGALTGSGAEDFPYRIAKVTTDIKYRFRAGDATGEKWYTATARPPLAFTDISLEVIPPAHTRLLPRRFDGMADAVEVPQGADVRITLAANATLVSAALTAKGGEPIAFAPGEGSVWTAATRIVGGNALHLAAADEHGETAETKVHFRLLPDRPPAIEVTAPAARTVLPPGSAPRISFKVSDDFGVGDVILERIALGMDKSAPGTVVAQWSGAAGQTFETTWDGAAEGKGPLVFRLVARDGYPFEEHEVKSAAIIFDTEETAAVAGQRKETEDAASALIKRIVELQKANLERTTELERTLDLAGAEPWGETAQQQQAIRGLTRDVLRSPSRPLGGMSPVLERLYMEEMLEVIGELGRVPLAAGAEKIARASRSVSLEQTILRKLTQANVGAAKVQERRKVSQLLGMLEDLVKGEDKIVSSTGEFIKNGLRVGDSLVDQQDELATAASDFVAACRSESASLAVSDKKFSELVMKVADLCEQKEVRPEMLRAAEKLEANAPGEALGFAGNALTVLQELLAMLNEWQIANAKEDLTETVEALHEAGEKMGKLTKLQSKVIESMKRTKAQADVSDEEMDLLEEDIEDLKENIKDALLQVPTDLHIFNELSVANELVEDVYSVFEEVNRDRNAAPESADDFEVSEIAFLKEEALLDGMKKAEERMDAMEMWLAEEADSLKVTEETFDQEELGFMALGALPNAVEDLVGDLIEEQEEAAEEADDGAMNFGVPDVAPGWEVIEGETTSFAAQGKSGNQAPDHKEQDGRSNVGRQGMASGETAAGSGTIGEGDPNIEKRMTTDPLQSGQVQADGEADENATGGGKLGSGAADDVGQAGTGSERRMDSTAQGSLKGLEALMAKTQALHVKASLLNLRTESLGAAAHHMRQANDAIAAGLPISQIREFQSQAAAALRRAQAELDAGVGGVLDGDRQTQFLENAVDGGAEEAPSSYRDLVAEYYKSLSDTL